jgi:uncharacterized protein YkwD
MKTLTKNPKRSMWALLLTTAVLAAPAERADAWTHQELQDKRQAMIEQVNQIRRDQGLPPYKLAEDVNVAAQWMAEHLSERRTLNHTDAMGRNPTERFAAFGGQPCYATGTRMVAENLAMGPSTAEGAVKLWWNSEGHRNNMLDANLRTVGIGYANVNGYRVFALKIAFAEDALATIINYEQAETDSLTVDVYTYGTDAGGNKLAEWMRFSTDGENWSDWVPYRTQYTYTFPFVSATKPVDYTLYVQLSDGKRLLNQSQDSIRYVPGEVIQGKE